MTSSNPELIILRGLPGSGKTTWARRYLRDHPAEVEPIDTPAVQEALV